MNTMDHSISYENMNQEQLREVIEQLRASNLVLEQANDALRARNAELEQENEALKAKNAEQEQTIVLEQTRFQQQNNDMVQIVRQLAESKKKVEELEAKLAEKEQEIHHLSSQVLRFQRDIFGSSSETMEAMGGAEPLNVFTSANRTVIILGSMDADPSGNDNATVTAEETPKTDGTTVFDETSNTATAPDEGQNTKTPVLSGEDRESDTVTGANEGQNTKDPAVFGEGQNASGEDEKVEGQAQTDPESATQSPSGKKDGRRCPNTGAKGNTLRRSMKNLPYRDEYHMDEETVQELDQMYGEGNWRIIKWEKSSHLCVCPRIYFVQNDYTPVIEYTDAEDPCVKSLMRTTETCPYFFPHSPWSPSLFASVVCDKFGLAEPLYRQSVEIEQICGLQVYRSTMARTVIHGTARE